MLPCRSTRQQGTGLSAGGTQRLAGAQAETGVVPRAANRIPDHQPLVQRPAVMRAGSADREYLLAPSHQQDRLGPDMAEHHRAVRKLGESRPLDRSGPLGADVPSVMVRSFRF